MNNNYRSIPSHPCEYVTEDYKITTVPQTENITRILKVLLLTIFLIKYVGRIMRPIKYTNGNWFLIIPLVGLLTEQGILYSDEFTGRS